ncbi:hypothetical protein ACHAWU_008926 [Discostella pseudostelligera]|uniref:UFSP1/2/DUB catalytic domain-containing protein n=1 Tax=Discostella pseudostelligera TaxID=259834 RepID=A0ABD3M4Z7_9STRA
MLLSSLMPTLLHHSTSSSCASFSQGVPCIEEIQRTTEKLWRQGYDIRNALHHEYKLVGKKTWIGAVEVWSYLSFMRIDSIIVQFIKTSQNRALLGRFAWAYFNRVCHTFGCSCCQSSSGHRKSRLDGAGSGGVEGDPPPLASPILTSLEYADHLLREVTKPNNVVVDDFHQPQHRCQCSIPPLYLQWEGHSVTVVGIKRMKCDNIVHGHRTTSSSSSSPESFSLIIFCPQKNVANVKSALTKEFHSNNAVAAAVYKSDVTIESKKGNTTNNSNNSILELPVTTLLHKDCQILLTTGRTIDEAESKRRTVCSNKVGFLNAVATA